MNKFFVTNKIYQDRIRVCKSCEHYFKLTGSCKICKCFMKIKTRISVMECPEQKWKKTEETKKPKELPNELKEAVLEIYPLVKNKMAPNQETKRRLIELYNTIFSTDFNTNSSCSSCLASIYDGIKQQYDKIKK